MGFGLQVAFGLLALLVIYAGVFSYWWISASSSVVGRHDVVRVHESDLMYHTRPIWKPAFWIMEHVGGYRYVGYIAAYEDSGFLFAK